MAQRVEVVLIDDLDGGAAQETVLFSLDGSDYEIDLSDRNAKKLRSALGKWRDHARKKAKGRSSRSTITDLGPTPQSVRKWARANGYELSDFGRVPTSIRNDYMSKFGAAG